MITLEPTGGLSTVTVDVIKQVAAIIMEYEVSFGEGSSSEIGQKRYMIDALLISSYLVLGIHVPYMFINIYVYIRICMYIHISFSSSHFKK